MDAETDYDTVVENGEVLKKSSWHNNSSMCDCDFSSELGNYRDVEVMYENYYYVFYHSTPIVIEVEGGITRLSSGGWNTMSTKERINKHLPRDYKLIQEGGDWFIETDDYKVEFYSGMVIETWAGSEEIEVESD